jgi:MFS family permease
LQSVTEVKARNPIPLYSLFVANAISLVGNVFSLIAIPWFVLQTTGSATQTGITGFFTILPVVLAGFLGGTLIDRLGYKRTSIIADLASGITTALIPLLHFTSDLEFWQLLTLVFLGALLDTPGSTARAALLPELAEQAGMPIERVTALTHVIERGARLVGAPLAWFSDRHHWHRQYPVGGCGFFLRFGRDHWSRDYCTKAGKQRREAWKIL